MSRGYKAGVRGGGGIIPPGPVVPDGKTVTPINDVELWIKCAGINGSTYTTLAEVLADTSLLRVLINSENAMDYLVRCKEWINGVELIPTMTSNTTPSGECSASSNNSTAFQAFDNDIATKWYYTTSSGSSWGYLTYKFTEATLVTKFKFKGNTDAPVLTPARIKLQGSNDNTNFADLIDIQNIPATDVDNYYNISNSDSFLYYRIAMLPSVVTSYGYYGQLSEVQLYNSVLVNYESAMKFIGANDYASNILLGDEDWLEGICNSEYFEDILNVKVPTMTSNTLPSGTCTADSVSSTDTASYKAFDDNTTTFWSSSPTSTPGQHYNGYTFTSPQKIKMVEITSFKNAQSSSSFEIKIASNDGGIWTDVSEAFTFDNTDDSTIRKFTFANNSAYSNYSVKYPVDCTAYSGQYIAQARTIQFYGRKDGGVQSWLLSAGITNKAYTSLSEVFSDTETLRTLLNNHDAVYYLTTVPGWATEFAANENAMKYIGANDYASDVLLANEEWNNAICNSTYSESVLNTKVPTMTSNTTPYGVCSASSINNNAAYTAFNNIDTTNWEPKSSGGWVQYMFTSAVKVYCTLIKNKSSNNLTDAIVQASNDNTTFINLESNIAINTSSEAKTILSNVGSYSYYRVSANSFTSSGAGYVIQFYGRITGGVQSWLLAAGITNKNYTTVAQVLADNDLLPVLIANHSGMDYLATCVAFASEICANETAMQLIGADNYAADALLSDETWLNAIANSTYMEYVLNVKVPTMTSNTTPSGVAFTNHAYNASYEAYKAFDNNTSTSWSGSGAGAFPNTLGYDFTTSNKMKVFKIAPGYNNSKTDIGNFLIEGSDDGVAYTQILSDTMPNGINSLTWFTYISNAENNYRYIRISILDNYRGSLAEMGSAFEVQFYGRKDV